MIISLMRMEWTVRDIQHHPQVAGGQPGRILAIALLTGNVGFLNRASPGALLTKVLTNRSAQPGA